MLELTWIPSAIRAASWIYLALALLTLWFAWWKPSTMLRKAFWFGLTLALVGVLPLKVLYEIKQSEEQALRERQEAKAELAPGAALLKKRCQSAGEKIYRTVDKVDGVVWLKWRERGAPNNGDQYKLDDPYGRECDGESCIYRLMRVTEG